MSGEEEKKTMFDLLDWCPVERHSVTLNGEEVDGDWMYWNFKKAEHSVELVMKITTKEKL